MKKLRNLIFKIFFYAMYPALIVAVIGLGAFSFIQYRDIQSGIDSYNELSESTGLSLEDTDDINKAVNNLAEAVTALSTELDNANSQVGNLEDRIETEQKEGYGEIRGQILQFISDDTSLTQYQRVCASLIENENKQYCVTASVLREDYILAVPAGRYYVFAELVDSGRDYRAYYTEFVECNQLGEEETCAEDLRENKVSVKVDPSEIVEDIDPIDWEFGEAMEEESE